MYTELLRDEALTHLNSLSALLIIRLTYSNELHGQDDRTNAYLDGHHSEMVGKWLRADRYIVLCTGKIYFMMS